MAGANPSTPQPGPGILGRILYLRGYVPSSALPINIQALQAEVSELQSNVESQKGLLESLNIQYQSLEARLSQNNSTIGSLLSELHGLQAQLRSLQSTVASDQSEVASLQAQVTNLKNVLSGDEGMISSLKSQLQSAIGTLQSMNVISATPNWSPVPNGLASSDTATNNPYGDSDPQDTGILGFIDPGVTPFTMNFLANFSGVSSGGGSSSAFAVPRFAAETSPVAGETFSPVAGVVARFTGYVPISQVVSSEQVQANLRAQVASLKSEHTTLQGLVSQAQTRVSSATAEVAASKAKIQQLQSQVSQLQSRISSLASEVGSLEHTIASLKGTVANLESQHEQNLNEIHSLTDTVQELQTTIQNVELGNIPVVVTWNTGDPSSSVSSGLSITHVYQDISGPANAAFLPSVTITATIPSTSLTSGRTVTKTFTLPYFVLGLWPHNITIGGLPTFSSGNFSVQITDRKGRPIESTTVFGRASVDWLFPKGNVFAVTDANGKAWFSISCLGVGEETLHFRSLRNPSVHASTSHYFACI